MRLRSRRPAPMNPPPLIRQFAGLKAGLLVAGGSDHMIGHDKNASMNPYNPFMGLWTSVTRKTTEGTALYPEERVTREEALRMYTIWGAHRQFGEKVKGSV